MPEQFFTAESMLTLAGATAITMIITNSMQHAFNFNPKWFGFVIAFLISIAGVIVIGDHTVAAYFIGVINGFFIYANSAGIMQMAGNQNGQPSRDTMAGSVDKRRKFFDRWYE